MKTIGLIGGMSWESTATYYRRINQEVRRICGGLHSAEIALRSLDFSRVVDLQKAGRWDEAGALLGGAGVSLAQAGASCMLICTNTMHLVAEPVAAMIGVPLIDIITETAAALYAHGRRRPLLLATRYTMEHGFYTSRMSRFGLEVMTPDAAGRQVVHDVIFDELCQGIVRDAAREDYLRIIETARSQGADSVILGCTEIGLLLDPGALPLPGYDSTTIHADAAVRFALGKQAARAA
ncbi:aspartate/glutamate racemase family protein [Devosia sp. XJ19-1]|uniref:Aspartate/glutamate racemase family protein n=1 Tax=Devosia ureilytica TaxID=2952754 RepID=A0A9Q4ARL0_9HYPH|nr:aspartate/glutamate racemase family protein [Devosia ureilytica]MCP8884732.1 aspartate/glutamate racemase family protein [Devosia ureilytica]MCP8888363.1 aspartate/glutamate racemase family protein [Devosia ureilytica]